MEDKMNPRDISNVISTLSHAIDTLIRAEKTKEIDVIVEKIIELTESLKA